MSTPKLSTAVDHRIERAQRGMQTAFPAKVVSYKSSDNTATLEPQFVETWFTRSGVRDSEQSPEGANIENVPVCFPHYMSWTIDPGTFGLVICTKYSLDQWRQQLRRMDPGDLRRFTMSGATFHPVVIGRTPSVAQQFVALSNLVASELSLIRAALNQHTHTAPSGATGGPSLVYRAGGAPSASDVGSSRVKAET